jgi:group II intron reverse transcriptase/maturase
MKGVPMTVKTYKVYAEEWNNLPWKTFQVNLYRLQHRIYKATKNKDKDLVKRLQRLLIGSKCSKYLAVRQVNQFNVGKNTPKIDVIKCLNPKMRFHLAENLEVTSYWKHEKLRMVYIPKPNEKKVQVGITTVRDRAMQYLLKYAIEPTYEAVAFPGSRGFRPWDSTWDVQKYLFQTLKSKAKGNLKRILELNIEKSFDNINHEKLLSLVTLPPCGLKALRSALKAGVLFEKESKEVGTPKGRIISPLLANIVLHGIEDLHNQVMNGHKCQRGYRYADDMIYFLKEEECGITLLNKIQKFLKNRGLSLQNEKTRFVTTTEGFDFLGWHFKVKPQNNKFICFPSRENRRSMISKIKSTVKDTRYSLEDRILKIKTMYRDWTTYHQYCDMQQINTWSINKWTHWYLRKISNYTSKKVTEIIRNIFTGHKIQHQ